MMFCGCRFLLYHLHRLASAGQNKYFVLGMHRTEQILCLSFILVFLLQVSSVHYREAIPASSPGNIPGPCRLLQVPCVMRPAGQHSITQAVGFRCADYSSEFETRHAMDCHRRKLSSQGTGCSNLNNSKSVFFTGRSSISSSIVREYDFLGAYLNHTEPSSDP